MTGDDFLTRDQRGFGRMPKRLSCIQAMLGAGFNCPEICRKAIVERVLG